MPSAPVRIAVAGAGLIGRRHIDLVQQSPRCRLAAVVDPSPESQGLAASVGVPHHRSLDDLFAAERPGRPDLGVIIATPNTAHVSAGLACVAARVPALVEKPIADGEAEAWQLVRAAEEGPALSKSFLADDEAGPESLLAPGPTFQELGTELHTGVEVEEVDRQNRLVRAGRRSWNYKWLVLATGARSRRLSPASSPAGHVHHLRELHDAYRFRSHLRDATRLVIVGGGLIGFEVAAVARDRGLRVTVVEAADVPLARVAPPAVSKCITDAYSASGVQLRVGSGVARTMGPPGRVEGVELTSGETIDADVVLACVGSEPNDAVARLAGIETDRGIVVDERMRTSDENILAVGDVARVLPEGIRPEGIAGREGLTERMSAAETDGVRGESWRSAQDQGDRAALTVLGHENRVPCAPWMWSDLGDIRFQAAGLGPAEQLVVRGDLDDPHGTCFVGLTSGRVSWVGGAGYEGAVARLVRSGQGLIEAAVPVPVESLKDAADSTALRNILVQTYRDARRGAARPQLSRLP